MRRVVLGLLCASVLTTTCSSPISGPPPSIKRPCTQADVIGLLRSFVRAIDAGDGQSITAALETGVIFSDDRRPVGGEFSAPYARDEIVRYFLDRHAAGERFELTREQANSGRDFQYDLKISAPQVGTHFAIGKGATNDPFDCPDQRINVWNMVRRP